MPSQTTILSLFLLSIITSTLAAEQNAFTYPIPGVVQNFSSGDTIDVSWNTTFAHPFLQLYCGGIDNPITDFSIPPYTNIHPVRLEIAAQTHCYLHMQDGTGFSPSLPSFGTGIFAIRPSNGTVATYGLHGEWRRTKGDCSCHCAGTGNGSGNEGTAGDKPILLPTGPPRLS